MTSGEWAGVFAGVVAVISGLSTFYSVVQTAKSKRKQDELVREQTKQAGVINEYKDVITDLRKVMRDDKEDFRKQIKSAIDQIEQKQSFIDELYRGQYECELEHAEMYGCVVGIHSFAKRQQAELKAHGKPVEDIPDLPPKRENKLLHAGFMRRTSQQNTEIFKVATASTIETNVRKDPNGD